MSYHLPFKHLIASMMSVAFLANACPLSVSAQEFSVNDLPAAGTMVSLSPNFQPALIKGLTVHQDNPFLFDFIVDPGQSHLSGQALKDESERMIKYFFAALTIPDKDIWVNLSPYEKDRMLPVILGQTAMGRDLLAQDYMLKQLTASLIDPQKALGKTFWATVYSKAKSAYGTTQIGVNTYNKVWIVPQRVGIYEHGQTAFIVEGHLKVMLDEDYLALYHHADGKSHSIGSQIIRQVILPEIEKEINHDKNFATLRQIFYAQALAVWFKRGLKQALLNRVYANKGTVKGIDQNDAAINAAIYHQYLKAYQKGVFNYVKEDIDPVTRQAIPRKYFSGGFADLAQLTEVPQPISKAELARVPHDFTVSVLASMTGDPAVLAKEVKKSNLYFKVIGCVKTTSVVIFENGTRNNTISYLVTSEKRGYPPFSIEIRRIYRSGRFSGFQITSDKRKIIEEDGIVKVMTASGNNADFEIVLPESAEDGNFIFKGIRQWLNYSFFQQKDILDKRDSEKFVLRLAREIEIDIDKSNKQGVKISGRDLDDFIKELEELRFTDRVRSISFEPLEESEPGRFEIAKIASAAVHGLYHTRLSIRDGHITITINDLKIKPRTYLITIKYELINAMQIVRERFKNDPAMEAGYKPRQSGWRISFNIIKDKAQKADVGGIDLSRQDAMMRVTRDVNGGVKVDVDPALIARVLLNGVSELDPLIIAMRPADLSDVGGLEPAAKSPVISPV